MQNIDKKHRIILEKVVDPGTVTGIKLITGGGSDRKFYRVYTANGRTHVILEEKSEHAIDEYVEIARFYRKHDIPAPRIYHVDKKQKTAVMDDVGDNNVQSKVINLLNNNEEQWTLVLYKKIIDCLFKIQSIPTDEIPGFIKKRTFDFEHYRWESEYFISRCVGDYFQADVSRFKNLQTELNNLAKYLGKQPRVLVHRDFQSQNVYVRKGKIFILDFQSARMGSPFYDLASLLKDPYVELPPRLEAKLFNYYIEKGQSLDAFRNFSKEQAYQRYNLVSLQRLMQALGAYGKLGLEKKKREFLKYIPPAVRILNRTIKQIDGMPSLKKLMSQLCSQI